MAENQFDKLFEQLEKEEWPKVYMFKFIIPNDSKTLAMATALFDENAEINFRESRNGKFVSISGKEMMLSALAVIQRYNKAIDIKGLIAL